MSNYIQQMNQKEKEVVTLQLLETQDDIVSPQNNIDVVTGK